MAEEYSSSGLFLVELLVEEVGQTEPCQNLVGLLEEEVEGGEVEQKAGPGQEQEELNQHTARGVLLAHWR